MPPATTADQAHKFGLFMLRAVMAGGSSLTLPRSICSGNHIWAGVV